MNSTTEFASTSKSTTNHWIRALQITSTILIGFIAQGSLAQTTTLNFDTLSSGSDVAGYYSNQGIVASGVQVISASSIGLPPKSGANVALAPDGLMAFDINASILSNVKNVSVYVTGPDHVGLFAYDSSGNLLSEDFLESSGQNAQLSVVSSGPAIARIEIHNGGSTFYIDDLSFTVEPSAPPVSACRAAAEEAYNMIAAYPASAYVRSKTAALDRIRLLVEVVEFEKLRAKGNVGPKLLSFALALIQADVKYSVKSSQNQPLLQKLNQINTLIKNNACQ